MNKIKEVIEKEVFVTKDREKIIHKDGTETKWLFDFRRVLLNADILDFITEVFWSKFGKEYPFQIGGLETASIPIITGLVLKAKEKGKSVNGFFIRKSRDKDGLTRMMEGNLTDDKIILVDDLINSGKTFIRQIEAIESLGRKVSAIFVILRFRDLEYYTYFQERKIEIISLFELNDFKKSLGIANFLKNEKRQVSMPFKIRWLLQIPKPNYFYVVPKSAPVLDDEKIYFGSDSGNFWAINQSDGKEAWRFKILGLGSKGKTIFSSPALYKDLVYFGAYDGNTYALDTKTGKRKWMFMEADWVGSSPSLAPDLGLLFVGEEFGLWKKHGGIVALDLETGEKKWAYREMPELTHCSPLYIKENKTVVIGSNDGVVYYFNAKNGKLLWTFKTEGGLKGEIKASFVYDKKRDCVCFGSFDTGLYAIKAKTGELVNCFSAEYGIYSTPLIVGDNVVFASLDKNIYCLDLNSFELKWRFATNGRIFASPESIGNKIYIGSNDGRLYELDAATGTNTAFFQATERITNKIAYNKETGKIFLPTFANEIYCLVRKEKTSA